MLKRVWAVDPMMSTFREQMIGMNHGYKRKIGDAMREFLLRLPAKQFEMLKKDWDHYEFIFVQEQDFAIASNVRGIRLYSGAVCRYSSSRKCIAFNCVCEYLTKNELIGVIAHEIALCLYETPSDNFIIRYREGCKLNSIYRTTMHLLEAWVRFTLSQWGFEKELALLDKVVFTKTESIYDNRIRRLK
jgi:hypothetical protein